MISDVLHRNSENTVAMYSRIRLSIFLAITMLASGCGGGPQQMIRVTIQFPGASTQEVADTLANPVELSLLMLPNTDSITTISSAGSLECYIVVARSKRPEEVLARIVEELPGQQFPPKVAHPVAELLPAAATIPAIELADVDCIVIDLNRAAAAEHGIPIGSVVSAIEEQAGGSASDMNRLPLLQAVVVHAPDDRNVPLTELAEIRVEKQPSHIVTRLPARN